MERCIFMCLLFSFVLPIRSQNYQCTGAQIQNPTEPCADDNDIKSCVQAYLSQVATCKSFENQGSDVIVMDNVPRYLPFYNTTTSQNVTISGLQSAVIQSFIVDETTDQIVLTTAFSNLNLTGPNTWVYYQNNKEPKTLTSPLSGVYPLVIFRSVMKPASEPNFAKTFTSAYVAELSTFTLGDDAEDCQDPDFKGLFAAIKDNPAAAEIETFQTFGQIIIDKYIQNELCNY